MERSFLVGTAGWGIASRHAAAFATDGTHLERYARRLGCVEINSSFYRPHRPQTYARWAAGVPEHFRFAVKAPKSITHGKRLAGCEEEIASFLSQAGCLGAKLGAILLQTPPNLAFDADRTAAVIGQLRMATQATIAFEPRHASWFDGTADGLFERFGVARVAADPARISGAGEPGGTASVAYFRFHGKPEIYRSNYSPEALETIAGRLRAARDAGARRVWCILDNTAEGHALANALALDSSLTPEA